jgi:hypothetical protein
MDLLRAENLRHGTAGFTSPPKEGVLGIFIALKNPLAGFEPANLGPRGQHASSRPPKPQPLKIWLNYSGVKLQKKGSGKQRMFAGYEPYRPYSGSRLSCVPLCSFSDLFIIYISNILREITKIFNFAVTWITPVTASNSPKSKLLHR